MKEPPRPDQWVLIDARYRRMLVDVWEVVGLSEALEDASTFVDGVFVHLRGGCEVYGQGLTLDEVHTALQKRREDIRAWEARRRAPVVEPAPRGKAKPRPRQKGRAKPARRR